MPCNGITYGPLFRSREDADGITASYGMVRRQVWLIGAGVVLGIGIWSMQYTAMWAFAYLCLWNTTGPLVLLSVLEGVVASIIALAVVSRKTLGMRAAMAARLKAQKERG